MTQNGKFHRSYDVQQLVDRLMKAKPGELVPYTEIDAIIGDHRTSKAIGRIHSARKIVQSETRALFEVVTHEGLRRLSNEQIPTLGAASLSRIRRESIRGAKRLSCADYDALTPEQKRKHDAAASHLGILAECSKPAAVKAITAKVEQENKKLTFDETLKAFR